MFSTCHRCGGEITPDTRWCDACQRRSAPRHYIRIERRTTAATPRRWQVKRRFLHTTAALLSLVVPGAGQVYKQRVVQGVAWFVLVAGAYALFGAPGLLVHLMCVVSAGASAPVVRKPVLPASARGVG